MLRLLFVLYAVCFGCYILFTREPDYFDGEFCNGLAKEEGKIEYLVNNTTYTINASYIFLKIEKGKQYPIIYNTSKPQLASLHYWWGYWVRWQEILTSVLVLGLLFYLSAFITKNPTPEALLQQLEPDQPQRKYS